MDSYHNLVSFSTQMDNEWHRFLGEAQTPAYKCFQQATENIYGNIKKDLKRPYLRVEVYLRASEDRSGFYRPHRCAVKIYPAADSGVKVFIEKAVKEREQLCDKLLPEGSALGPIAPYSKGFYREAGFAVNAFKFHRPPANHFFLLVSSSSCSRFVPHCPPSLF